MSSFHPLLNSHTNLRMKNCESVLSKLDCMSKVGTAHLMIMADFDYTITKRWSDKDKNITCPSTFDVIKRSSLIDKKCAEEMKVVFQKKKGYLLIFINIIFQLIRKLVDNVS